VQKRYGAVSILYLLDRDERARISQLVSKMFGRSRFRTPTKQRGTDQDCHRNQVVTFAPDKDMVCPTKDVDGISLAHNKPQHTGRIALNRASTPKADMCGATSDVRFGPEADIAIRHFEV
jgi:hypothetical protein